MRLEGKNLVMELNISLKQTAFRHWRTQWQGDAYFLTNWIFSFRTAHDIIL